MSFNDELRHPERAQGLEEVAHFDGDRTAAVETQNGELREANEHLILATIEAQELREAAQTAGRRQDEFLAMLAHELRNPLGPIRNAVEILARLDGQAVPRSVLDIIRRQVQQMVRLLDDLLDVSRVTQGKVTLQRRPTDIAEFIHQAVEATSVIVKDRGQQLTLDLPAVTPYVDGDEVRLAQVFSNLLQNASKYTQVGGAITLRAERVDESVVMRVIDNGMGISAKALPHVFDLFSQEERAAARSQGGLGIGLTVVRSMVEMHQGSVEVFSAGSGQGSEFVVTLPRLEHGVDAVVQPSSFSPSAAAPARVLLIEDNVDAGEALAELLRQSGHEVAIAVDGRSGLEVFDRLNPHVVLCDIGLPGLDGYEVADSIRQRQSVTRPVLVALTGYGSAKDRQRSAAAGFDHHVVKPVDPEVLLEIIGSAPHTEIGTKTSITASTAPGAPMQPNRLRIEDIAPQPPATDIIARLQGQVESLQQQVNGLKQALSAAERRSDQGEANGLVKANSALVFSAIQADEVAESAMGELANLTRVGQRDVLTGTPNRALMLDRMGSAIALARRRGTRTALLFVDLDGFKQINDTQGHAAGDAVLCLVARRLESVIRESDTVSRHGGDEFLVLLAEISHPADAALIAAKMLHAIAGPGLPAWPAPSGLSASVGIAVYPEDGKDAEMLISNAKVAMYRCKKRGPGNSAFFSDADDAQLLPNVRAFTDNEPEGER